MCTSVRFSNTKGNMFFGRNLDWEFGYGEGPVIAPRNWNRTWRFEDDAHRQLASRLAQEGTRPQAVIGIGIVAEDTPLYFDCMNESGLAAGGLLFAGFAEYEAKPVEGKLNVTAYELPLWVCRNFTTVDQAQAALEHVAIVGEGIAGMDPSYLHWMIADGTRSIVVEYMTDGMHIHDDKADVLANQPAFDWHLENHQMKHRGQFYVSLNVAPEVTSKNT